MKQKLIFLVVGIALVAALVFTTCEMSVNDPMRFIPINEPYISGQPRSYSYLTTTFNVLQQYLPAKLEVKVADWNRLDGTLYYQWYEFTSIDDYCTPIDLKDADGNIVYEKDADGNDTTTPVKVPKKGDAIPDATGPTYDPVAAGKIQMSGGKPVAKTYYYYVEITNKYPYSIEYDPAVTYRPTDPARQTAIIQSEMAVISISESDVEPIGSGLSLVLDEIHAPVLVRQPASASYPVGRDVTVAPLTVEVEFAKVPGYVATPQLLRSVEGSFSYKWYSNTTYSVTAGTEIIGENKSTYTPDIATLPLGETYYYVEVTNTNKFNETSTVTCLPAVITMVPSTHAAVPRIDEPPRNVNLFGSEVFGADPDSLGANEVKPLSVTAVSTDKGILSYQWYQLDKAATTSVNDGIVWETWKMVPLLDAAGKEVKENGQTVMVVDVDPVTKEPIRIIDNRIPGATSAVYAPTVASGSAYFGVEITNTNNTATVQKTASVRSRVITVTRTASVPDSTTGNAVITIPNGYNIVGDASRMQYIRGYGAMDVAWANFPETEVADTELQYNPDWGLGFNILRIMVVPPGSNAGNFTSHASLILGGTPGYPIDKSAPNGGITMNHRKDYINNVKVVNKYGGYVLASPWTPPKEWKTNNSINSGGHLIPAYYQSFAGYLREFAQFMYYQGAPIFAVSIANEPNYAGGYDGCEWTDAQMRDFWLATGRFTEGVRGYGGGKYIPTVMTMNGESANNPKINFDTLNNPTSRAAVDLYARHVYGDQTETLWKNAYADYREGPNEKECWMTEHNINSATATAFYDDSTWPWVWRFMNDVDLVIRLNNENAFVWWAGKRFYSFVGDGGSGTTKGTALPRGWGLSHYAKYSIGTRRIDLSGAPGAGTIAGTTGTGAAIVTDANNSNVNPSNFDTDTTGAKITAYVSQDGSEISFVMFTPTLTTGANGVNMGDIEMVMPAGFKIGSAKAQRSTAANINSTPMQTVPVGDGANDVRIAESRDKAFVTLNASQILSVKFTKQ